MPNTNETYNKMKQELSDLRAEMSWLDESFFWKRKWMQRKSMDI